MIKLNRDLLTSVIMKAMIAKGHLDLARMLANTKDARKKNEKLLFHILKTNKNCEFGKKHGFADIHSVEDFRRRVPISTFHDYEDYVIRMIDGGEENLMTSLPLVGYAQSSGSVGRRKFVPLTQPEVDVYTRYTVTRCLAVADRWHRKKYGKGLTAGRGMFTCSSYDDYLPNGMLCSNVADVAAKQMGFLYPYILNVPFTSLFDGKDIDFRYVNARFGLEDKNTLYIFGVFIKEFTDQMRYLEQNWETIVDDIEKGTVSDIARAKFEVRAKILNAVKPNPERAAELREIFRQGFDETITKRIWPNLSVLCSIGTSTFAPFAKIARRYTKDVPFDFSIYGASEGLFAAVDELDSPDQLLLVDSCFYEFIPVDDESKLLLLDELEVGKEYEIIITNQAGLYRYKCGDVIKVTGFRNECPYLQFSHRKGQLLNLTGEKTTEEHMAAVVKEISKVAGCPINNWAVYNCVDNYPYHYVLLMENKAGIDLRQFNDLADEALGEINIRYRQFVDIDEIGRITIENQQPGTHRAWADSLVAGGAPITQIKPVRILDTPPKMEFFTSRIVEEPAVQS